MNENNKSLPRKDFSKTHGSSFLKVIFNPDFCTTKDEYVAPINKNYKLRREG